MSPQPQREPPRHRSLERRREQIAMLISLISATLLTGAFLLTVVFYSRNPDIFSEIARAHFRALMGVPMGAMMALAVVSFLHATEGNIEFEALGCKFKGASGPIVLFVLTYLAIVAGGVALW